ncbi:MAG: addiction module toxin RelE [Deltaproteobacteria bacterium]|nr:addiction module toxin RelE [Deltaproteobacteria bacterium]
MSRPLRIQYPGAVYHITSRGNEKKPIFKDDQDRQTFLSTLEKVNQRYHWLCHAYCLMDNHFHLLIETPEGNLSLGMRQLNGVYTQRFNKRHGRVGHLFQGRYKAILIQKDSHLLESCRYVVLNPVRASLVEGPRQWKWSSYGATAGQEKPPACLSTGWVLEQFSDKKGRAENEYRKFVRLGIGRESIWEGVKGQIILGEDDFVDSLRDHFGRHQDVPEIPRSQRYATRPTLENIFKGSILSDRVKRDRRIREAVEKFGYTQRAVADYLGFHFTYVSRILNER